MLHKYILKDIFSLAFLTSYIFILYPILQPFSDKMEDQCSERHLAANARAKLSRIGIKLYPQRARGCERGWFKYLYPAANKYPSRWQKFASRIYERRRSRSSWTSYQSNLAVHVAQRYILVRQFDAAFAGAKNVPSPSSKMPTNFIHERNRRHFPQLLNAGRNARGTVENS